MKFRDSKRAKGIVVLLLSLTFVPGCSKESPEAMKGPVTKGKPDTRKPTCGAGDITIIDMYLSPADSMATGALYCTLANHGTEADSLTGLSTPITPNVEIHEMIEDGGMMTMRKIRGGFPIAANSSSELKPGGAHVMLINVDRVMKNGDSAEIEFRFARGGKVRCMGYVRSGPSERAEVSGEEIEMGAMIYQTYCQSCHQADGKGVKNIFPPLAGSDFMAEKERTIDAIVNGKEGKLAVSGAEYNGVMPPLAPAYDDKQAAAVINYVVRKFGNGRWSTTAAEVTKIRKRN